MGNGSKHYVVEVPIAIQYVKLVRKVRDNDERRDAAMAGPALESLIVRPNILNQQRCAGVCGEQYIENHNHNNM